MTAITFPGARATPPTSCSNYIKNPTVQKVALFALLLLGAGAIIVPNIINMNKIGYLSSLVGGSVVAATSMIGLGILIFKKDQVRTESDSIIDDSATPHSEDSDSEDSNTTTNPSRRDSAPTISVGPDVQVVGTDLDETPTPTHPDGSPIVRASPTRSPSNESDNIQIEALPGTGVFISASRDLSGFIVIDEDQIPEDLFDAVFAQENIERIEREFRSIAMDKPSSAYTLNELYTKETYYIDDCDEPLERTVVRDPAVMERYETTVAKERAQVARRDAFLASLTPEELARYDRIALSNPIEYRTAYQHPEPKVSFGSRIATAADQVSNSLARAYTGLERFVGAR